MKKSSILCLALFLFSKTYTQKIWDGPASGGSWAVAANWNSNVLPAANDIVIFPAGISGTISNVNSGNNITLGGLIVQGNSNITLTNSANRTITVANGSGANDFNVEAGATLVIGSNVDITLVSGTTTNHTLGDISGTMVITAGRNFDTNNGNVTTNVNGTIQNEGTVAGNTTRLTFSAGSDYIHARAGGNIPNATWDVSSTCRITGITGADPGNDNQAFGHLVYNCPNMSGATRNLGGNGLTVAGNLEIINTGTAVLKQNLSNLIVGGSLIITGGIFRIGDNTIRTITVSGDVSLDGGTLQMSTGNNVADRGILNVAGNFSQNGGIIAETSSGRGVINFAGNATQSIYKNISATISGNIDFTVNSGASVDFGTSVLNGSTGGFTLSDNAKIITKNTNGIYSTGNVGAIQVGGARIYSSQADYEFSGAVTGIFTTTTNPQVRNLIVNNPDGNITLSQPFTVNGALTLTSGILTTTPTNLLTIAATGSATPATSISFVNGPMAKVFALPLAGFTFPVGKSGAGFRNIAVSAPSAPSTFVAEYFRTAPPIGTLGTGIVQLSACEYWNLSRTAGPAGTSARVTLSWESGSSCGSGQYVTEQTSLRVAHLTGGTWVNEGYLASTGNNAAGTITSGNILTTFSPFALAGSYAAENPLPILFSDVKAYEKNNGTQLEWTNLTEKDVANYVLERSADGKDFSVIKLQMPLNNRGEKISYQAFDESPVPGVNFYRIRILETSGSNYYSKILNVNLGIAKDQLVIYPNPARGGVVTLKVTGLKAGHYHVKVVNMTGQDVSGQRINVTGSALTQVMDFSAIKPGVYSINVTGNNYRGSQTFVIQ